MEFESMQYVLEVEDLLSEMNSSINNHISGAMIVCEGREMVTKYIDSMKKSIVKIIKEIMIRLDRSVEYSKELIMKTFNNFFSIRSEMLEVCRYKDLSKVKLKTYEHINTFYNNYLKIYRDPVRVDKLSLNKLINKSTHELESELEKLQDEYKTINVRLNKEYDKTKEKLFGREIIIRGMDFQTLSRLAIDCNMSNWHKRIDRLKYNYKREHWDKMIEVNKFDVLSENPDRYLIVNIYKLYLNISLKESIMNLNNFRKLMMLFIASVNSILYRCSNH